MYLTQIRSISHLRLLIQPQSVCVTDGVMVCLRFCLYTEQTSFSRVPGGKKGVLRGFLLMKALAEKGQDIKMAKI